MSTLRKIALWIAIRVPLGPLSPHLLGFALKSKPKHTPMKYDIYLLPHLQEMEGMEQHCGEVEAPDKATAIELAVKTFGQGGYFSAFDFDARPKEPEKLC